MEKEVKKTNPPTLEGLIREDRNLILECLEISNCIYSNLTGDNSSRFDAFCEPDCMMADAIGQKEMLKTLNQLLIDLKTTILN